MSHTTSFVIEHSNTAERSLKRPRVPLLKGKSNIEEWKNMLIQTLEVQGLEDYVQKEVPEPADPTIRGQWKGDRAKVNLLIKRSIPLIQNILEAAGWNRFTEEDPKAFYELIQRVIPNVSTNAIGDMVTELGAVMALIDMCPPPDKLTPFDGSKPQLEDLCMRLGGSLELESDFRWACSFLSAVKAGPLTPSLEPNAPAPHNSYPRLRPTATHGPGGWAFTITNLGEALMARAPTGGRSQLTHRPRVSNVGTTSADSVLTCEAFPLIWYWGRTVHGEADLREWWVRWINVRRNSYLPGSAKATGSQLIHIPPLGPSSHYTREDSMRLALNYYLRVTTPLLSFTEYSARQHIATLAFTSGIALNEEGDVGLHEATYLCQASAQLLDLFDPATHRSYWHGGPFAGPGADLLAVTLDAVEEAVESGTLTGACCIICFLYSVSSTRHRKLYYDNRPGNHVTHVGRMDHDNPYVGLVHAVSAPGPAFALWEQSVDLHLQRICDWQHALPPTTAGFTIATNVLGVGGSVCNLMRQLTRPYVVIDRAVPPPPLCSYFTVNPSH
ncbi:hypothetical protein BDP27DRAFT_1363029 [Rhodocollybia butyracea]|uniref:Uncharacterized protein n=1 Tax=Rhodocollybia butyracea TaxID=206335 RepID=A0A9P5U8H7_9AGAR|nr:hypothetical protein BDP27DRAFT_1363029 [Rhodocollybia butyracea]